MPNHKCQRRVRDQPCMHSLFTILERTDLPTPTNHCRPQQTMLQAYQISKMYFFGLLEVLFKFTVRYRAEIKLYASLLF